MVERIEHFKSNLESSILFDSDDLQYRCIKIEVSGSIKHHSVHISGLAGLDVKEFSKALDDVNSEVFATSVRADMFNAFNHPYLTPGTGDVTDSTFNDATFNDGGITAGNVRGGRIIQFQLRYQF